MLGEKYSEQFIRQHLLSRDDWHPFPRWEDRSRWDSLSPMLRTAQIRKAESYPDDIWKVLPATTFLQFSRQGNRKGYESVSFARRRELCDLVIAECLDGKGRFTERIADAVWSVCEESFWGAPAHLSTQKAGIGLPDPEEPIVDLFVGETAGLLSWCFYLLRTSLDLVSPQLARRIIFEVNRRMLVPCLERDDFWWMGFDGSRVNNWNPWCNSNFLTAVLLLEQDEHRRAAAVCRIMRSLDKFIDPYPADGGCDEGPGYWSRAGASLFDCLELLHSATQGMVDIYDEPLIQEMGRYICRVFIHDEYFINFADASPAVSPSPSLVYRFGKRIDDQCMLGFGAALAARERAMEKTVDGSIGRRLPGLFCAEELENTESRRPLARTVWLPVIQVMSAREQEGSSRGFFVAAKGGHNEESHNHNDIGNFIVYNDGKPLLVDIGVETYTAKTFSDRRYEIWTMQSAYHNLPTIDGVMQHAGQEFQAREARFWKDGEKVGFSLDIASAYPPDAHLKSWERTLTLSPSSGVTVRDSYELSKQVSLLEMSLITPCDVQRAENGRLMFGETGFGEGRSSGTAVLHFEPSDAHVEVQTIAITDEQLGRVWGERLVRVVLSDVNPSLKGSWDLRFSRIERQGAR